MPTHVSARRIAIVLMNLGGPDGPAAVRPFLFNLFSDPAIIGAPEPFRTLIAALISSARARSAAANYALMGGGSPIVPETLKQAEALEAALAKRALGVDGKLFIAMRYWPPRAHEAAAAAKAWGASEAILLPLYPQFSSTTTASSLREWRRRSDLPATAICCYPRQKAFARAHADLILQAWNEAGAPPAPRVLFSAHGLPEIVVKRGDPYQWQVERSVEAVRALLPDGWSHRICYQSRVGPLKWLGPSTIEALDEAGRDRAGVIVSPIAFVSEHIETLVELDIEYAAHARAAGLPFYLRAPALGETPAFIEALADLVEAAMRAPRPVRSGEGARICPAQFGLCPHGAAQ